MFTVHSPVKGCSAEVVQSHLPDWKFQASVAHNLRGAVVSVMDLSNRFDKPSTTVFKSACIIIVEGKPRTTALPNGGHQAWAQFSYSRTTATW